MSKTLKNIITCIDPLSFPFKTPDPFLFCVYHKDQYPAGNERMEAPREMGLILTHLLHIECITVRRYLDSLR